MRTRLSRCLGRAGYAATATGLALVAGAGLPAAAWAASGGNSGTNGHGQSGGSQGSGGGSTASTSGPAGNNGTVKVHGSALNTSPANQPHVGCNFYVDFYGFDAGQTADVSLTGQAPTGAGTSLFNDSNAQINPTSSRGQGNTWDSEMAFTTHSGGSGNFIDLSSLGAPAHQGYHIRLSVDPTGAPGGSKTKVFWVQPCTGTTGGGGGGMTGGGGGGTTGGGGGGTTGGGGGGTTGGGGGGTGSGGGSTGGGGIGTTVLGEHFTRSSSAGTGRTAGSGAIGTSVLGESLSAGTASSLPFTGADIAGLTVGGLAALGGGTAALVALRRRRHATGS